MPILPSDFLELTEFSCDSSEIQKRNAVSRSYYGVYHIAEQIRIYENLELPNIRGAGIHKRLCIAFAESGNQHLVAFSGKLDRQRLQRKRADYDLTGTMGYREAHRETEKNKTLFTKLSEYLQSSESNKE